MIEVRDYAPGDIDRIDRQDRQAELLSFREGQASLGPAFTIWRDGKPILSAGLARIHDHYASCWAVFARGMGADYLAVARCMARVLAAAEYRRIDVSVPNDWPRAHRLVQLLGFGLEGVMVGAGDDGGDVAVYARIRAEGEA